jgi:probable non-F420 flavinoid oxidoreductase
MQIAYHASHEQFSPSELLRYVQLAQEAGFDAIHSSDHFHPWSERQGESGFSFAWIAAAMQSTTLPFSMVCAPGQRYHPAIVAQAIATIAEMFPGRYSVELGSGEALNENITGESWPSKEQRNQRLLESASVIRELLEGKEVSFNGTIHVKQAKLYTLPTIMPDLFCAAISAQTAGWAAQWADGLLTTAGPVDEVKHKIDVFREHGGNGKPIYVQAAFSVGHTKPEAVAGAYHQWRSNLLPPEKLASLKTPRQFDEATAGISMDEVKDKVIVITCADELLALTDRYRGIGVDRLILHNVNRNQEDFIRLFETCAVLR